MGIRFDAVRQSFDGRDVLSDLSLTLAERRIGVIGANGSGKSSFARLINGLSLPTDGRVTVDGLDTRRDAKEVRARVGFIFQNPDNQIVFPIVHEDVAFGLTGKGRARAEVAAAVEAVLARYGIDHLRDRQTHRLSGGEKQLLALAGVLATEPAYLVMDEPTTLLDLRNTRRIRALIDTLDQTVVLVTHDLSLLEDFERVLVFDEGRLVADDVPAAALPFYVRTCG